MTIQLGKITTGKKGTRFLAALAACLAVLLIAVPQTAVAAPTASVSGVSVSPNPLCPAGPALTASATIGATYDADGSSTTYSSFTASSGTFGGNAYTRTRTKTVTAYVYTEQHVTATANGASQTDFLLSDANPPYLYSGAVTPSAGDGSKSATVAAVASEKQTATATTSTEYWTGNGQGTGGQSTLVGTSSPGTVGNPVVTSLSSSTVSASANYVVDLTAPVALLWPDNSGANPDKTIRQSQSVHPHVRIEEGSSGQTYTLTATATGPGGVTYTSTAQNKPQQPTPPSGTFGNSSDGIAAKENRVWSLEIPCDAPLGEYTLSVTVDSNDLCGDAWPQVLLDAGTFTVTSGLNISAQTVIVTDLGTSGYGESSTFTAVQNKKTKVINATPGSWHVTTTLTTAGPCAGFGSYSPSSATLLLDPDFVFADSGGSPAAHIFMGETGGGGFDLHSGAPLVEVAGLPISFTTDLVTGRNVSVTVDLSSLGSIPSTTTIYIRSHFKYLPFPNVLPSLTTDYTFGSSTMADAGTDSSSATLTLLK